MLIYDPALDPYHSGIRVLAVALASAEQSIETSIDAARIADYFLVYPAQLLGFRLPTEFRSIRTEAKRAENPYRHTAGTKTSFERMRPVFFAALSGLVAANIIDETKIKLGTLALSEHPIPVDLTAAVSRFRKRQTEVGNFILSKFLAIPTNGKDGLKHRSGLIEHRYDIPQADHTR